VGGTLTNSDASRTLPSASGALDGVTLGNDFNLTGTLFIRNGLTLGNGVTFNLNNNTMAFQTTGTQHIGVAGSVGSTATLSMAGGTIQGGNGVAGQTLQIDTGVTVQGYGNINQSSAASIVNNGNILSGAGSQTFSIVATGPGGFTNNGIMNIAGSINVGASGTFINGGTLSPGALGADNTSTLAITGNLFMLPGSTLNLDLNGTAA